MLFRSVLSAGSLEPQGIDDDVKQGGGERQNGRQQVGTRPQNRKRHDLEGPRENDSLPWSDDARHERSVLGALHQTVDVTVDDHIQGICAACG